MYRYYHRSFKVFGLQAKTLELVAALQALAPDRKLNSRFMKIVIEGTGKTFGLEHHQRWDEVTRPILEAFFHARFEPGMSRPLASMSSHFMVLDELSCPQPYLIFRNGETVMTQPANPHLEPGRVYRTQDLAQWSANPPRLAKRLVKEGALVPLARGLFAHPKRGRFGAVPPGDEDLLRAFLDDAPFVITGPARWNTLGLGATAVFATPLVYNTKRSGSFSLGGRGFQLRRVAFPSAPTPEWYVVDLFEHSAQAGVSRDVLTAALKRALAAGRFDAHRLRETAERYATKATRAHLEAAMEAGHV